MPSNDYEVYFQLIKQSIAHLDQRISDFDKRMDVTNKGMSDLHKELQKTNNTVIELRSKTGKLSIIDNVVERVGSIENVQNHCPGRNVLRWGTLVGVITVASLCLGVFFQWHELKEMRKDNLLKIELIHKEVRNIKGAIVNP